MSIPTPRKITRRDTCSAARQYLAESSACKGPRWSEEKKSSGGFPSDSRWSERLHTFGSQAPLKQSMMLSQHYLSFLQRPWSTNNLFIQQTWTVPLQVAGVGPGSGDSFRKHASPSRTLVSPVYLTCPSLTTATQLCAIFPSVRCRQALMHTGPSFPPAPWLGQWCRWLGIHNSEKKKAKQVLGGPEGRDG